MTAIILLFKKQDRKQKNILTFSLAKAWIPMILTPLKHGQLTSPILLTQNLFFFFCFPAIHVLRDGLMGSCRGLTSVSRGET